MLDEYKKRKYFHRSFLHIISISRAGNINTSSKYSANFFLNIYTAPKDNKTIYTRVVADSGAEQKKKIQYLHSQLESRPQRTHNNTFYGPHNASFLVPELFFFLFRSRKKKHAAREAHVVNNQHPVPIYIYTIASTSFPPLSLLLEKKNYTRTCRPHYRTHTDYNPLHHAHYHATFDFEKWRNTFSL